LHIYLLGITDSLENENQLCQVSRCTTIILPSKELDNLSIDKNDQLITFNFGERSLAEKIDKAIKGSKHDCIILLNPFTYFPTCDIIRIFKDNFDDQYISMVKKINNNNTVKYTSDNLGKTKVKEIDNTTSISFSKTSKTFDSSMRLEIKDIMKSIIVNNRKPLKMIKGIVKKKELEGKPARGKITLIEKKPSYMNIRSKKLVKKVNPTRNLQQVDDEDIVNPQTSYSFIIPYMHNEERYKLFSKCIENLPEPRHDVEICIHETGKEPKLNKNGCNIPDDYKYMFTKYDGNFNRGWSLNLAVREMSTGDMLLLMDGDLVVNESWVEEVFSYYYPIVAWNKINFLNKKNTEKYIKENDLVKGNYVKTRVPNIWGAAGGSLLIPRRVFFKVKGYPELFDGWGGEDNAMLSKLHYMGYPVKKFKTIIYHMYHSHKTKPSKNLKYVCNKVLGWNRQQWVKHLHQIGDNWGKKEWKKKSID
jgi:hypothetical protein